ncbi:MAG TPA: trypsin-like peptidase domain-containing protein [Nocardioides sp.]|nr:trypsin-like peptidase domain-containing protein [Nocardioides sp.]
MAVRETGEFFATTKPGLRIVTGTLGIVGGMTQNPYVPSSGENQTAPLPPTGPTPPRRSGRGAFAASVIAASLVVGGAAGVGGAAAWDQWHADEAGSTSSGARTTSQVVDTPEQPAAQGSVEQVAQEVLPSVVKIDVSGTQQSGSGSGIILSSDGQILTNNHVAALAGDSGEITVSFNDGSSAPAKVLGTDPLTDTAVIQAEGVEGLTPATIGKSADLAVGQGVVAIGSPFGLESTVTSGIVSALDRPVDVGSDSQGNTTAYPAIQTDAAINPGNSGGPLVDLAGHVVGINSSIRTASGSAMAESGSIGLGFAIPIDEVMPIVDQMVKGETPTHARLGIQISDLADRSAGVAEGAQIREVSNGSTADSSGLERGDVITRVDDHQITGADSLVATIRAYRPGDKVTVTYVRDGDTRTAELTLDSDVSTANS